MVEERLTAREAALQIGVNERTIRRAIARGELGVSKQGGVLHISPAELERYQQRRARQVKAKPSRDAPPRVDDAAVGLPTPATPLIGRCDEVAEVLALFRDGDVRLVTLTGPGGVGKTRLALEIAAVLARELPDSAAFIPLETVREPEHVVSAVARAIRVPEGADQPLLSKLREAVRQRRQLLVIDNFEQVLDAASVLAELLAAGPGLRILVTSREMLKLRGEHELVVDPLPLPETGDATDVGKIGRAPAVELFVQRARAVQPAFALSEENAAVVGAICAQLDGLPLAIELAAPHIKHASPELLRTRLERRLDLLKGGARDLPDRLQTMRAAIAWSYGLLTPEEQAFFRRLGVFSGGFDLKAAKAVGYWLLAIGSEENDGRESSSWQATSQQPTANSQQPIVLDLLTSLVDKSLVRAEGVDGERRYRLLETIREFGAEELAASGEADVVRARHAAHFMAVAEAAGRDFHGSGEGRAFNLIEANIGNFRAALAWASGEQGEIDVALRLANVLWWFWYVRGYQAEGSRWMRTLLSDPRAAAWPEALAYATVSAGWLAIRQILPQEAKALQNDALLRFQNLGDAWGESFALAGLGYNTIVGEGDAAAAATLLQEALARAPAGGQHWLEAGISFGLTLCAVTLGDMAAAQATGERTLALSRADGDSQGTATTLAMLGNLARWRGDVADALSLFSEALEHFQRVGETGNICMCVEALAGLLVSLGRADQGAYLFGAAAHLRQSIGTPVPAHERAGYEADLTAARAALGAEGFAETFAAGERTPLRDALTGTDWRTAASPAGRGAIAGPAQGIAALTRREHEVLLLVAEGRTDREIGEELSISPATVTKHVGNVLAKLGVRSRTEAAVFSLLTTLD